MSIQIAVLLLLAKGAGASHGVQLVHDRTLLSELGSELFILPLHPAVHITFLLCLWGILPVLSVIDFPIVPCAVVYTWAVPV